MTTFYKNYVALCAQKKKSASAVAVEIGLSRTSPNGWKKGKQPSDINLEKLASYFNVSVGDLLSEQKEKSPAPEDAELSLTKIQLIEKIKRMDDNLVTILNNLADEVLSVQAR